jgi:hypothetical protein
MTTSEVLRAAKARIGTPEQWCGEGGSGKNDRGGVCAVHAIGVALGAATCTYITASEHPAVAALLRGAGVDPFGGPLGGLVAHWNDTHTHAEVMAAFDRAIANEEAREQEFTASPAPALETV